MRLRLALLWSAALLASPALAQTPAGFYVAAGIGVNKPQDTDLTTSGPIRTTLGAGSGDLRFEPQAMGVMALGYGFGNGIRVELEGSVRANAVDHASTTAAQAPVTRSQGQLWNYGLMANALYDLDVGAEWIRPYLGVGLGYVWSEAKDFRLEGNRRRLAIDSSDGSLAYQAIIGAAFPIEILPGLSATAEYRFMGMADRDYAATLTSTGRRQGQGGSAGISPYHHSILVGLRYAFGGAGEPPTPQLATPQLAAAPRPWPAPPIQLAPAAPVARSFIIYFGLNSASLTSRAREVVAEAARAARDGAARIEVGGHTDSVGSAQANQRLSERRAAAVASELRRQGIRSAEITVRGYGEAQPALATGDGVGQARNRRVEILLR